MAFVGFAMGFDGPIEAHFQWRLCYRKWINKIINTPGPLWAFVGLTN